MLNSTYYTTDMLTLDGFLLFLVITCLLLAYLLVRFRFYPIIYFVKGTIIKDKVLSNIESVHLKSIRQRYGIILSISPILGFSWGFFGISLTTFVAFNKYFHYFTAQEIIYLLTIINNWVLSSIVFLAVLPILFLITKLPVGFKRSLTKHFLLFIFLLLIFSLSYSYLDYKMSIYGLGVLLLLAIPCIFSSWFIGQYFAIYIIRSFFQADGWDFVLNQKVSIFGRLKGFFSFVFAILTPIIAINSLIAVLFHNTNKGGYVGIYLLSLPKDPIHWTFHWTFAVAKPWTFTFVNPWYFTFTKPSFGFLTNVIILFLIVGPLVTFIFRPTYIFELTLNSKIYQTLINFNWEHFKANVAGEHDSVIIHSLTVREMIAVLIFFISFINYVAILSVGAVIGSFHINLDNAIGLGILNGTIKLIEIPVLFFVEYLILHDLSEERELIHLALKGLHSSSKPQLDSQLSKKRIVPQSKQSESKN